jgi:hypothetical protein
LRAPSRQDSPQTFVGVPTKRSSTDRLKLKAFWNMHIIKHMHHICGNAYVPSWPKGLHKWRLRTPLWSMAVLTVVVAMMMIDTSPTYL